MTPVIVERGLNSEATSSLASGGAFCRVQAFLSRLDATSRSFRLRRRSRRKRSTKQRRNKARKELDARYKVDGSREETRQRAKGTQRTSSDQPESGVKRVPSGVNEANYGLILISQLAMRPRYCASGIDGRANLRRHRPNEESNKTKKEKKKKKKLTKKN